MPDTLPPPARRPPALAPALALLIAFVALGSCRGLQQRPAEAAPELRTLAVVGDSITASAADALQAESDRAGWTATIDATPGAMTAEKRDAAESLAARSPAAAVIHLGTNDSMCIQAERVQPRSCRFPGYTPRDRDGELAGMARALRGAGACVIGVVPLVDFDVSAAWARMRADATVQGVADWRAEVERHRAEYVADALGHLTDAGKTAYARFIVDAVEATCATAP